MLFKNIKHFFRHYGFFLLSFFLPIFILGIVFMLIGMYPFGDKSILISDMNNQYIDFFAALRRIVYDGGSPFYSWSKVLGGNIIGLISYYVSSPLNLIILLFPAKMLTEAILCLSILKVGLSGLTCSVYLKYISKSNNIFLVIFSLLYSLMAYSVVYMLCIMWLDALILLPLILLGIEKLLKENRFILFTVSLFALFISNYYMAYMVCIFSTMYFLYRYFIENAFNLRKLIARFSTFSGAAILAAGCSAFILLPTYLSLKTGKLVIDPSNFNFAANFKIFDIFSKLLIGSYDTITNSGMPVIYCGLTISALFILFFSNKAISTREKFLSVIMCLALFFSMYINLLNVIWHGFQPPVWFSYRYSFLFSFMLIFIAYRSFMHIDSIESKSFFKAFALLGFIFILVQKFGYAFLTDKIFLITICFLAISGLLFFVYIRKLTIRNWISIIILVVVIMEVGVNSYILLTHLNKEFTYDTRSEYVKASTELSQAVDLVRQKDPSFYRMDETFNRSLNDAIAAGFNGVTHYSSSYDNSSLVLLKKLGFFQEHYWAAYNGSTILTDSLFGIKYIMSKKPLYDFYSLFSQSGDISVYSNPYALPVGFMVDSNVVNLKLDGNNCFELQNRFFNSMLTNFNTDNIDYFTSINYTMNVSDNIETEITKAHTRFYKIDKSKNSYIDYELYSPSDAPIYFYAPADIDSSVFITINNRSLDEYYLNKHILYAGTFKAGEKISIRLTFINDNFYYSEFLLYAFNLDSFMASVGELEKKPLKLTEYSDTVLKGMVQADENQVLFTTIPYDAGWKATVDGKIVQIQKVADALVAIKVPEGEHDVEFRFFPAGMKMGIIISVISLFVLIMAIYVLCIFKKSRLKKS